MQFRVSANLVLLTALYVQRMSSADPIGKSKGYVEEIDIGFWLHVYGGEAGKPFTWRPWFLPIFLCVNAPSAMASGREIFGYPKSIGNIERKSVVSINDATVRVSTEQFEKFGPNEKSSISELFSINKRDTFSEKKITDSDMDAMSDSFFNCYEKNHNLSSNLLRANKASFLPIAKMPMIFLKQFRDLTTANAACFQQIASVVTESENVRIKSLSTDWTIEIQDSASHPLRRELGLETQQQPELGFAAELDFTVGFGDSLWSAG